MDEKPGREQMKQLVLRSGTDEDMKRSLGFVTSKWGQEQIKELWMWPLFAYLIFFSSWIDIRKHFRKKRGTLWWSGVAMIMIVTAQDGWQPCVVLYRTGICHHHGVILHHLKLTEEKSRNGCGGKEIQIWCWGFTIHLSIHSPFESETIYIMVVNGGVNLCWSAGYYNLQKAPYCNNACGEYLPCIYQKNYNKQRSIDQSWQNTCEDYCEVKTCWFSISGTWVDCMARNTVLFCVNFLSMKTLNITRACSKFAMFISHIVSYCKITFHGWCCNCFTK